MTSLIISLVVNALVTGLILFRILKVFLEVKPTSVERTLGPLSSTGGSNLRHIIFIITEPGMALFAIQLVRIVVMTLLNPITSMSATRDLIAFDVVVSIHQIFNVIIRSVHFFFFCFTDDIYLARASHQQ